MADLKVDGDSFYDFAEEFADDFCPDSPAPPPGPKGYGEICPPDLTIGEWRAIAHAGSWPREFWMVG